jgi:hypothetical protein
MVQHLFALGRTRRGWRGSRGSGGEGKATPYFMVRIESQRKLRSDQVRAVAGIAEGMREASRLLRTGKTFNCWVTLNRSRGSESLGRRFDHDRRRGTSHQHYGMPGCRTDAEETSMLSVPLRQPSTELGALRNLQRPRKFKISITGCKSCVRIRRLTM